MKRFVLAALAAFPLAASLAMPAETAQTLISASAQVTIDSDPAPRPPAVPVEVVNLPAVQQIQGGVSVSNLPLDEQGGLMVSAPRVAQVVLRLLEADVVLAPQQSWESQTFDPSQYTRMYLKVEMDNVPQYTQMFCGTSCRWTSDESYHGSNPWFTKFGHATGFALVRNDAIEGSDCKITCINDSGSGLAQAIFLRDIKVLLRRE